MDKVAKGMSRASEGTTGSSTSNGLMNRILHSVRNFLGGIACVLRGNSHNANGSC